MNIHVPKPMSADEFVRWAAAQKHGRYELVDGVVVKMNAERVGHARVKARIHRLLSQAIEQSGIEAEALPDGISVRIDEHKVHEPDCLVRCGPLLGEDVVLVKDPVIVVEVLSPSTGPLDTTTKLAAYMSVPSIAHYLVVNLQKRLVHHYYRDASGQPVMRTLTKGSLRLEPPGLEVSVDHFFV